MSVQEGRVTGKSERMPGARGGIGKPNRGGKSRAKLQQTEKRIPCMYRE